MKTITVDHTWRGTSEVEVDDDFEIPTDGSLPNVIADQLDSGGASLTDWEFHAPRAPRPRRRVDEFADRLEAEL